MDYEDVLLIGGTHDGRRTRVARGIPSIKLPRLQPAPALSRITEEPTAKALDCDVYRLDRLHDGKRDYVIYVADGVNPIATLLEGYRTPHK